MSQQREEGRIGAIPASQDRSAALRAEPAAQSQAKPAAAIADEFQRRVQFSPSYDRRAEGYGIGNVRIWFYLIGPAGAVQWQIGTNWYVPSAQEHLKALDPRVQSVLENSLAGNRYQPQAWDLGYHSREPLYDYAREAGPSQSACEVLGGDPCYYDGSSLNAELLIVPFLEGGDKAVWEALEAYYRHTFEGQPWPFDDAGKLTAATTAKTGAVEDESAVGNADAPNDPSKARGEAS